MKLLLVVVLFSPLASALDLVCTGRAEFAGIRLVVSLGEGSAFVDSSEATLGGRYLKASNGSFYGLGRGSFPIFSLSTISKR